MYSQKSLLFILFLFSNLFSEINPQFSSQRHTSNPRFAGLSNAGAAIPEGVSSVTINPALIHNWHWINKTKYSTSAAYERDSVFSKHIISTGASWQINNVTTIGSFYRNLKNSDENFQNEVIVCVAGRMFDKSVDQGAVNFGMNMRIERLEWESNDLDSLSIKTKIYTNDSLLSDTSTKYPSSYTTRSIKETRLLFDLGFFQDNIFEGLDFGLTFHNLFTRRWKAESPSVTHSKDTVKEADSLIFLDTTTTIKDSAKHSGKWEDTKGRNHKVYKRMTIGLSYHTNIVQNKVMLLVPLDIEFLGLFDKRQDVKVGLHTGLEAWLNHKICLRFGYAFAANEISGRPGDITFKNGHLFSGGAGVRFERIGFDVYIRKQDWGLGSTVSF